MTEPVNYPRDTSEFVDANVTGPSDVTLDTQPVEISINRTNEPYVWLPAEWVGSPGTTRKVRTSSTVTFSVVDYPQRVYHVFVRVTDSPAIPIMAAGQLTIG